MPPSQVESIFEPWNENALAGPKAPARRPPFADPRDLSDAIEISRIPTTSFANGFGLHKDGALRSAGDDAAFARACAQDVSEAPRIAPADP